MATFFVVVFAGGISWLVVYAVARASRSAQGPPPDPAQVESFLRSARELTDFFTECIVENAQIPLVTDAKVPENSAARCVMSAYYIWGCSVYVQVQHLFPIPARIGFLRRVWDETSERFDVAELNAAFEAVTFHERDKIEQARAVIARVLQSQRIPGEAESVELAIRMSTTLSPLAGLFLGYLSLMLEKYFRPARSVAIIPEIEGSLSEIAAVFAIDEDKLREIIAW